MKEKYLPIGSIVVKKGNNRKFMIIGYSETIYSGKMITYDYSACPYPEGLLLKNQNSYFNHDEIEEIIYMGYESVEYKQFLETIVGKKELNDAEEKKNSSFKNIQFDENGIVVFDGSNNENETKNDVKEQYQFDENGFVIGVTSNDNNSNPFVFNKDSSNEKQVIENKDMSIFKNIQFDENGFVVSAEEVKEETNKETEELLEEDNELKTNSNTNTNNFKFDENGFVISDGEESKSTESNAPKYKFDENGVVMEDGEEVANEEPKSNLKFDENGFVISE